MTADDVTRPGVAPAPHLEYLEAGDVVGSAVLFAADELHAEIERLKCRACHEWAAHVYGCPAEVRT